MTDNRVKFKNNVIHLGAWQLQASPFKVLKSPPAFQEFNGEMTKEDLIKFRESMGWTQLQMAEIYGYNSERAIRAYELGERPICPRFQKCIQLTMQYGLAKQ